MTTLALLLASALAAELPPPTDLDGDGKPERIVLDGDTVRVGEARAGCGSDSFPCELEVHDLTAGDNVRSGPLASLQHLRPLKSDESEASGGGGGGCPPLLGPGRDDDGV